MESSEILPLIVVDIANIRDESRLKPIRIRNRWRMKHPWSMATVDLLLGQLRHEFPGVAIVQIVDPLNDTHFSNLSDKTEHDRRINLDKTHRDWIYVMPHDDPKNYIEADEPILHLAQRFNGVAISGDGFKNYRTDKRFDDSLWRRNIYLPRFDSRKQIWSLSPSERKSQSGRLDELRSWCRSLPTEVDTDDLATRSRLRIDLDHVLGDIKASRLEITVQGVSVNERSGLTKSLFDLKALGAIKSKLGLVNNNEVISPVPDSLVANMNATKRTRVKVETPKQSKKSSAVRIPSAVPYSGVLVEDANVIYLIDETSKIKVRFNSEFNHSHLLGLVIEVFGIEVSDDAGDFILIDSESSIRVIGIGAVIDARIAMIRASFGDRRSRQPWHLPALPWKPATHAAYTEPETGSSVRETQSLAPSESRFIASPEIPISTSTKRSPDTNVGSNSESTGTEITVLPEVNTNLPRETPTQVRRAIGIVIALSTMAAAVFMLLRLT